MTLTPVQQSSIATEQVSGTAPAPVSAQPLQRGWGHYLLRREALLVMLLIGVFVFGAHASPYFWDGNNILDDTSNFMEIAMMALPMTLIIIAGHIDLSVGSTAALSAVVFATGFHAGWNVWLAAVVALGVGVVAGLFNGLIITRMHLPSLVVTLGTYALYRGIGSGLLGNTEISGFPPGFAGIDLRYLPGTHLPGPLLIFIPLAIIAAFVLHATSLGRYIYAIGNNEQACRFAGVAVDRVVLILFTASGAVSALAGLVLASRQGAVNYTLAQGFELTAITSAVLGGANIFGGEGSMLGTVLGVFIIGMLQAVLTLINVNGDIQTIAVGVLLIASILVPGLIQQVRSMRRTQKGGEARVTT